MPDFFGKKRLKQDTATKTQEAMGLATAIGQYNMANRTDEDVRGTFQGLSPEEKTSFAKGLYAERGAQDPLTNEIGGQAGGGRDAADILNFTPADFRRIGGKPGFKLRGSTQYAIIEQAFLSCSTLPEETKEQIEAKKGAYSGLQMMCLAWKSKHNLAEGGSGDKGEARKGNAVMQLYVHTEAKKRQLTFAKRSAPTEADAEKNRIFSDYQNRTTTGFSGNQLKKMRDQQWHNKIIGQDKADDLRMVESTSRTLAEKSSKPGENSFDFHVMRENSDAFKAFGSVGAAIVTPYVFQSCYGTILAHLKRWKTCVETNTDVVVDYSDALKTTYTVTQNLLNSLIDDLMADVFSNLPQELLEITAAHIRGLEGYDILDLNNVALDKGLLAASSLFLRLISPVIVNLLRATQAEIAPGSDASDDNTLTISVATVRAAIQSAANGTGSKMSTPSRVNTTNYTRSKLDSYIADLGTQIMALVRGGR